MPKFKPVLDHEGSYTISKEGIVRSLAREIVINNDMRTRVKACNMVIKTNKNGQKVVVLSKNSYRRVRRISTLIKEVWG